MRLPTLTVLAIATAASAQQEIHFNTHQAPGAVGTMSMFDKGALWVAYQPNPNQMLGSSLRSNASTLLTAPNPLTLLAVDRNMVVADSVTNTHYALNFRGNWVAQPIPTPAANLIYGRDLMGFTSGSNLHVFHHWLDQWLTVPLQSGLPLLDAGRTVLTAVDGPDRIIGISTFGATPNVLTLPANPGRQLTYLLNTGSTGVVPVDRNLAAYSDATTNEIYVFSGKNNDWVTFTTSLLPAQLQTTYNKNILAVEDTGANTIYLYSAHTSQFIPLAFSDLSQVQVDTQDFGIRMLDQATGDLMFFRALDGALLSYGGAVPNLEPSVSRHSNDHLVFGQGLPTATQLVGVSSTVRGAQWNALNIAGQTPVGSGGNDTSYACATDTSLHGFSSFSNQWTSRSYQGTFTRVRAQDFFTAVETSTHIYIFVPQRDLWIERAKQAGETTTDDDAVYIIRGSGYQVAIGMESTAFQSQTISNPIVLQGKDKTYAYAITDNGPNASLVYFYSAQTDRWVVRNLPENITASSMLTKVEDGFLLSNGGNTVYAFSSFGDLNLHHAHPLDNYAFHAHPGQLSRLLAANGPVGGAGFLLFGFGEASTTFPGIQGALRLDVGQPVAWTLAGTYDARGTIRYDIDLTNFPPVRLLLQMASLDSQGHIVLGALERLYVH